MEQENIPLDMPEVEEPIRDEHGNILSRYQDYWKWHDEIKRQLL